MIIKILAPPPSPSRKQSPELASYAMLHVSLLYLIVIPAETKHFLCISPCPAKKLKIPKMMIALLALLGVGAISESLIIENSVKYGSYVRYYLS